MKYIKKYKYFFTALALALVIIPLQTHAFDDHSFDIVGWYDESCNDAVTSVKVNGIELSEYNASMFDSLPEINRVTAEESSVINVEITLEEGYTLSSTGGPVLYLSGVQSGSRHISSSTSTDSIQLPPSPFDENDQELYLEFTTERDFQSGGGMITIDNVELDAKAIDCAAEINEDHAPDISVPSNSGYRIVPDSVCPVEKEGSNYIENISPYVASSRSEAIFKLDLEDRGSYVFSDDLDPEDITIHNGKVLDCDLITSGGPDPESAVRELCLTVSIELTLSHSWGECIPLDSTTHQKICANDSDHVVTENHTWDAGKVTKEATCSKTGVRTYTCTGCKATRTKSIPKLDKTLLVKLKTKGKTGLIISWTKVSGAEGYDIFFRKCDSKDTAKLKKIKTIKGNKKFSLTKKDLKKHASYKASVKAWKKNGGKKTYIRESLIVHTYTGGGTKAYTDPKAVTVNKASATLNKGKTFQINAKVIKLNKKKKLISKNHDKWLRYLSSNKEVATVSSSGKITAVGKGACKIYVVSVNGVRKTVKVTVK